VAKRSEPKSQCAADIACSNNPDFHICLPIQLRIRSGFLTFKLDGISRQCAWGRFFAVPKVIIFPSRCITGDWLCNLLALERTSFLIRRRFRLHRFSIFVAPGRLDGRSVGTNNCGPRIALVACSSSSVLTLNLI
jgi:hypothetical protein